MFPHYDIVCTLLETPFSRLAHAEQEHVLEEERPTPVLNVSRTINVKTNNGAPRYYKRKFKSSWYEQYRWLCGSYYLEKLFCWPCVLISNKYSVWNKIGFDDFLNVTRGLHSHEGSADHIRCILRFKHLKKNANTAANALKENERMSVLKFNENVRLNRRFMELPIDVALYIGKWELTFCTPKGDGDFVSRENYKELLQFFIERSPEDFKRHYRKIKDSFRAESTILQYQLIDSISQYIEDYIAKEVDGTFFFSIQVDDISDMVQQPQVAMFLRYVNFNGILVERFLGLYDISIHFTEETLFNSIRAALQRYKYKSKLIAQSFVGAYASTRHLNYLHVKMKDAVPQATCVPSLAYHLNVALKDSVKQISKCREFFASVSELVAFFRYSNRNMQMVDPSIRRCISSEANGRWSSNSNLLSAITTGWDGLQEAFEKIVDDPYSDRISVRRCGGFLQRFSDFEFAFLSLVFLEIFQLTENIFNVLQRTPLNVNCCLSQIKKVVNELRAKTNDNEFQRIVDAALSKTPIVQTAQEQGDDDGIFQTHKALYHEILNSVVQEIVMRFKDMEKLLFISLVDITRFEEYFYQFPVDSFNSLKDTYPLIFNPTELQRLKNELTIIYSDEQYRNKTLVEVISLLHENKDIFKESYKLFCLVLTIPSTCVCNQRYSCIRNIRIYVRNLRHNENVSSSARVSIEKELLSELQTCQTFYEDVIKKFVAFSNIPLDLIYKSQ